jgi:acetyl esterase/lipase
MGVAGMVMPIDRHAKRLLEMIAAGRRDGAGELTAESLRRSMLRLADATDARRVPIAAVEDRLLPGPATAIPVRVYTPCDSVVDRLPCIAYFHGGTGVFCGIETHDGLCRMLANASGCKVVSVGYRLAPEHPFPSAIEDSLSVTTWIAEHGDELNVDRERLVVAGDSAGGTMAAVLCQLAARGGGPRIALQVLLCPVTDLAVESESRRAFAEGYFIERSTLEWAKGVYCAGADLADPRVSPLRAASFEGLPPAHIHTAEFDPMRDEGEAYANALTKAGVPVRYSCHAGLIHHFYCMAGAIPHARTVLAGVGADIRCELGAA